MPSTIVFLHLNCSGCNAEAWLNGIPVTRVEAQGYPLDSRPVHEYLLPGVNDVALVAAATGLPTQPGRGAWATLQIKQGPRGVLPDDPQVLTLASLKWQAAENEAVNEPVTLRTSLTMSPAWPRWSWLDGSNVTLSKEFTDRVAEFLQIVADRLRQGDVGPYVRAAEIKFAEVGRAYDISGAQARDNFVEQFRRLSSKPEFAIAPIARETMAPRLCAGGKVIDCVDTSFEPLLRAVMRADGVVPVRYPVKLAVIGSQIRIVR